MLHQYYRLTVRYNKPTSQRSRSGNYRYKSVVRLLDGLRSRSFFSIAAWPAGGVALLIKIRRPEGAARWDLILESTVVRDWVPRYLLMVHRQGGLRMAPSSRKWHQGLTRSRSSLSAPRSSLQSLEIRRAASLTSQSSREASI